VATRHVATLPTKALPLFESMAECGGWVLDTYEACDLRCVYCITGAQGVSTPRCTVEQLGPRMRAELAAIPADARIIVGALADAYPLAETETGFTRHALAELASQGRSFHVITKGEAVLRDLDLFLEVGATVTVSLCTVDEEALRTVDPRAPGVEERIETVQRLREAGVTTVVSCAPWIPGVSDAVALLERVPDVWTTFAPLNVLKPKVADTPFGRRFDQRDINEAYLREVVRVGPRDCVAWQHPIPLTPDEPVHHPFESLSYVDACGAVGCEPIPWESRRSWEVTA
jgi:DNA repair photolyase